MPRALPGHCEAEIEGRDYTKGEKGFTLSRGVSREASNAPRARQPQTVAVNSLPLLGCWRDPLQESHAPVAPDMPQLLACHAVQSGQSIMLAF